LLAFLEFFLDNMYFTYKTKFREGKA
jgi:hypothetical protein